MASAKGVCEIFRVFCGTVANDVFFFQIPGGGGGQEPPSPAGVNVNCVVKMCTLKLRYCTKLDRIMTDATHVADTDFFIPHIPF